MARYRFFAVALAPFLVAVPAIAQQGPIIVSSSACDSIAHINDAPGVAYTPGVDADGNAVAPADLPGGGTALNQAIASAPVKITVDLQKRFGIPANATLFQGESQIGYVTIQDGKAYLDGQPLNVAEQGLLATACRERER
ncbi:MAG TPA: hypothetical protein VHT04_03895 [Stellaceae bacterium]|jgi:hypothetical protein|nr:hypothetical protein [Stellaceae bacterium]